MNRVRVCLISVSAIVSMVCFGQGQGQGVGQGQGSDGRKIAPDLAEVDQSSSLDIIIQFLNPADENSKAQLRALGASFKADLALQVGLYNVPARALEGLSHNPNITYITPDRNVAGTLDYANPAVGAQFARTYGWDGTGVGVAIIDSGINDGADLWDKSTSRSNVSRIVYSQNFVAGTTSTADQYGHGTHVAGIVAGNGSASTVNATRTFRGIAPNANLINLKVLDSKGMGTDSAVIKAIDAAIQQKNKYNIRVINLSLGRAVYESYALDPLCQAVERAWRAGIVVVVAAGNNGRQSLTSGYATITAPGNDPLVITVGAMKTLGTMPIADDQIASYSSKGPTLLDHVVKPDLVAPGNQVISLLASKATIGANSTTANKIPLSYYQNTSSKTASADYYRLSGTSMAAPMVSGAAALMLTKDWSLNPDTVKARMMKTATKTFPQYSTAVDPVTKATYTSQYDLFTVGAGYLNIWDALNSTDVAPTGTTAASPIAVFSSSTSTVTVVNANAAVWGTTAVWGSSAVWGTAAVWGSSVFVDGASAVWGTAAVWGSTAVWGTQNLGGNTAVWGSTAVWGTTVSPTSETMSLLINGEN